MAISSGSSDLSSASIEGTISITACAPMSRCSVANARAAASYTGGASSHKPLRTAGISPSRNRVTCSFPPAAINSDRPRHTPVLWATFSELRPLCMIGMRVGKTRSPSFDTSSPSARAAASCGSSSSEESPAMSKSVRRGSRMRSVRGVFVTSVFQT
eukprot:3330320-Pleurochrysis_carterae.AAC.1